MTKFGLWYVKWDSSSGRYTSRLKTLNKSQATVEDFKERFDIAVVTTLGGFDAKNSGNGYEDGKELATFTKSIIGTGVEYYISMPYYPYDPSHENKSGRGNIDTGDYWLDWIDGVLAVNDPNLKGFYWELEYAWMFTDYQKGKNESVINPNALLAIADKIHDHGLEFIWIPSAHTYALENTDIWSTASLEAFDYIFVQSNYYMNSSDRYPYSYTEFKEWLATLKSMRSSKVHIEMEADECVLGMNGNCRNCGNQDACLKLASDYYLVQHDVLRRLDENLAYYFGVTLDVVDEVFDYYLKRMGVV